MKPDKFQQLTLKTGDNVKLNEYQVGAVSTAIYPGKLAYPTLGLCGEAGELTAACAEGRDDDVTAELGDVLWYVANVAADCDLALSVVCKRKMFQKKTPGVTYWDHTEACQELCIHVGVVAENVKKTVRDTDGVLQEKRQKNIVKALRSIMEVLAELAGMYGTTLEECAKANIAKLKSRQDRGKLKGDGDRR